MMKIFVAGATGTLGRPVVRTLLAHGHDVVGMTRTAEGARRIEGAGAKAVIADALDGDRLRSAVARTRPEQVVHLLTALPPGGPLRRRDLDATNVLRTAGTANLIRAAVEAGAVRIVAESFVGVYGTGAIDSIAEDAPLPPVPGGPFREAVLAMRSMEDQLRQARDRRLIDTVALRIGGLYGSDVPSIRALLDQARKGRLFAPRKLPGLAPFVHVDDAAAAIVAAVEAARTSPVYNISDDEPISMSDFLQQFTQALGTRPPRTIPVWLARLAAPLLIQAAFVTLRLSNDKAKQELGWTPRYPTVRDGLRELTLAIGKAA
jgi:nucleoside-diphosphate-sugar epimerase